jgi:putative transposase
LIEPEPIWHFARGSGFYTSADFRGLVISLGMRLSMGRGVCWDNNMADPFFSMLKNERLHRTVYATTTQTRKDLIPNIEGCYNSRRRHSGPGYRRPNEVHCSTQRPALAAEKYPLIPLSEIL